MLTTFISVIKLFDNNVLYFNDCFASIIIISFIRYWDNIKQLCWQHLFLLSNCLTTKSFTWMIALHPWIILISLSFPWSDIGTMLLTTFISTIKLFDNCLHPWLSSAYPIQFILSSIIFHIILIYCHRFRL